MSHCRYVRTWHLLNWSIRMIFHFIMNKWFSRGNIQPTIHHDQPIWTVQATSSRHLSVCRRIFFRILTATSYELHLLPIIVSKNQKTCIKKHTLLQCWIRWVIQIPSVPWITAIYTASSSILRYVYDDAILKQRNGKINNFSFFVMNLINLKWRHLIIMYLW